MTEDRLVTEVPSSLKRLARLVVRGFYSIEEALIVDMLVRNPCMKEDDICELLKFERKMLRARIAILRNDKFIQVRLKMETGADGKAQKVNYYFINYKTFVNVVKYKLDLMRKRLETEERDATSRASFKCPGCLKTFTDLEADQLFDFVTGEFRCTFCREIVEEDQSALPKKDSRLLLAKFNEQLEQVFELLKAIEGIRLAPEILEPEPVDISTIRGLDTKKNSALRPPGEPWSGEASRNQGFAVEETRVDVTIGDDSTAAQTADTIRKERPIWMMESTIITNDGSQHDGVQSNPDAVLESAAQSATLTNTSGTTSGKADDIMSVLLAHEKKGNSTVNQAVRGLPAEESDSSDEDMHETAGGSSQNVGGDLGEIETMDTDDEDDNTPTVTVGSRIIPITDINDAIIAEMTPHEKEVYIQVYQDYYSHMYD